MTASETVGISSAAHFGAARCALDEVSVAPNAPPTSGGEVLSRDWEGCRRRPGQRSGPHLPHSVLKIPQLAAGVRSVIRGVDVSMMELEVEGVVAISRSVDLTGDAAGG